jgi:putative transposase
VNVLQAATGRLYPTRRQGARMGRIGGQCRALWNHFLGLTRDRYEAEGKFVFYTEMSAGLPALRREERFAGLPHRCAQMAVQKLDRALRDCAKAAKARKGFPRFKSRDAKADAFQFVGREVRVEPNRIKLPALGWLRVRGLRVPDDARLVQATVRQAPCATGWEISLQFEGSVQAPMAAPAAPMVGIDFGLSALMTLSTGEKIAPPRLRAKLLKRQRRLNRERDRRRKGSVNRRRTVARLARLHRRTGNARRDYLHKRTREVVERHAGVALETLRVKAMARTRMAGSLSDVALGEARRQIVYKGGWNAREIREFPAFHRSTGVCPATGEVGPKLPLSVREWWCQGCAAVHDRDVAAAKVILLGAVPEGIGEPASGMRRKRGAADRGGARARARVSHGRPPANVAGLHAAGGSRE